MNRFNSKIPPYPVTINMGVISLLNESMILISMSDCPLWQCMVGPIFNLFN